MRQNIGPCGCSILKPVVVWVCCFLTGDLYCMCYASCLICIVLFIDFMCGVNMVFHFLLWALNMGVCCGCGGERTRHTTSAKETQAEPKKQRHPQSVLWQPQKISHHIKSKNKPKKGVYMTPAQNGVFLRIKLMYCFSTSCSSLVKSSR